MAELYPGTRVAIAILSLRLQLGSVHIIHNPVV